jgi:hypothetical protein
MDVVKQLTNEIFAEYQEDPVPMDLWLKKKSGHVIFVPNRGVLMYHDRIKPSNRLYELDKKSTHIWLCGVVEESRREGIAKAMLRSMLSVSNPIKCQDTISAHINRKKFPEMVACLEHLGFKTVEPVGAKSFSEKRTLERFEVSTITLRQAVSNVV